MPDYNALANTARNLIREFGDDRDMTLTYDAKNTYDPTTNTFTANPSADAPIQVKGVELKFKEYDRTGNTVQIDDVRIFLEAVNITRPPSEDDTITYDGVTYNIVVVKEIKPGLTPVYYDLQLRK